MTSSSSSSRGSPSEQQRLSPTRERPFKSGIRDYEFVIRTPQQLSFAHVRQYLEIEEAIASLSGSVWESSVDGNVVRIVFSCYPDGRVVEEQLQARIHVPEMWMLHAEDRTTYGALREEDAPDFRAAFESATA